MGTINKNLLVNLKTNSNLNLTSKLKSNNAEFKIMEKQYKNKLIIKILELKI